MLRYLLGELPESEAAHFEEQYNADEAVFEELAAMEAELIDAYVHGELSPERRGRFESKFLASAEQRQKVEDGMRLAGKTVAIAPRGWVLRLPSLAAIAAAAALMIAGALFVTRWLGPPHSPALSAPRAPTVFSFVLGPGLERGAGREQNLAIPSGTETVRLEVDLDSRQFSSLDAVLETASGEGVWSRTNVPRTLGSSAEVDVPARLLRKDLYILTLTGQTRGASAIVGEYSFRVTQTE